MKTLKKIIEKLALKKRNLGDTEQKFMFPDGDAFIKGLTANELTEIIKNGEKYLELTEEIRLHNKYMIKDSILDKDNPAFSSYDPRSLNLMLDEMYAWHTHFIENIKEEKINRKQ